jgi:hypothetical protein
VAAVTLAFLALALPSMASPPGATAKCRDGTFSFALHHSGACSHHGGVAAWLDGSTTSPSSGASAPSTGAVNVGTTVIVGHRLRTTDCLRGVKPDRRCSPGAYYSRLTKAVICSASFHTGSIRNVPQSEKFQVETEYGMPARLYGRSIEIDHIVPLELGGSNDIANLYPEPGSRKANYHVKDELENKLHDLVCSGAMELRTAQRGIATNWETIYKKVFGAAPSG